jgi:FtsP/CotA-like multicopper oxidase with cupredoxin domain
MDMDRIDEEVRAGTTEIWEVRNNDGFPHSFHPHLVHFAVLDVGGDPPPPELSGWKDTVYVPPNETVRLIARFDGAADPDTPYMFHCHVLAHEDGGMMGQFVLI